MRLFELKGSDPFKYIAVNPRTYTFSAGNNEYVVEFGLGKGMNGYYLAFSQGNLKDIRTIKITKNVGGTDASRIFQTIISIIKDFLSKHPDTTEIVFTADWTEPSRVKLYDAMVRWYRKFQVGDNMYLLDKISNDGDSKYSITKVS